jgi:hypothetical protein
MSGMKHALSIMILATGLLAGSAIAQSPPPAAPGSAPVATRSIKITAEQGYVIKENVLKGSGTVGQETANSGIEIGAKAPANLELHEFPPIVIEKVPAVKGHKFFAMSDQVVIVDPKDNLIADIIK